MTIPVILVNENDCHYTPFDPLIPKEPTARWAL
jgi:hypothetical protein